MARELTDELARITTLNWEVTPFSLKLPWVIWCRSNYRYRKPPFVHKRFSDGWS